MNRGGHFTAMGIDRNTGATSSWNDNVYKQVFARIRFCAVAAAATGRQHAAAAARGRRFRQRCTLPPENSANPQQLIGNNGRRGHTPMKW
jgi:hypothetical protein